MQKLSSTRLTTSNLKLKANVSNTIQEVDTPIPMNIFDYKSSQKLESTQKIEGVDLTYIKHINKM
jgi:hypothetical protein